MPDEPVQDEQLTNEEQIECLIGSVTLPVPPRRMRIKQSLKIDEIEIKGRSGKIKQPIGYQDARITIDLEICDKEEGGNVVETARERLEQVQRLFRSSREAIQEPQEIVSTLTDACGIPHRGRGKGPRVHDIRHTFAVHTIERWYKEGTDLGVMLPVLATYLGHQGLAGTQRYLRLTPDIFPDITALLEKTVGCVIPRRTDS